MVAKLKGKFVSIDYIINLFRKLQKLKQREMVVKEYTKDYYRPNIRFGNMRMKRKP